MHISWAAPPPSLAGAGLAWQTMGACLLEGSSRSDGLKRRPRATQSSTRKQNVTLSLAKAAASRATQPGSRSGERESKGGGCLGGGGGSKGGALCVSRARREERLPLPLGGRSDGRGNAQEINLH